MKRILIIATITIGSACFLMPLLGAGQDDYDLFRVNHDNLYARAFLDPQLYPNQPQPTLEELDSGGGIPYKEIREQNVPVVEPEKKKEMGKEEKKEKTGIAEKEKRRDTGEKRRGVFNLNLMAGGSIAYYNMKRVVDVLPVTPLVPSSSAVVQNELRGKYLGFSPGMNLNFIFNVAKYFALGFGADASYFYPYKLTARTSLPIMVLFNYPSPNPQFYLEVPVYGLMRFYFSEKFRAAYLSLGAGVDFFLLGRPSARSIIARGGIGFTLDNGFTMEFAYQYNTDLAQESSLTNIKDMHRGMIWMGYCFNTGGK